MKKQAAKNNSPRKDGKNEQSLKYYKDFQPHKPAHLRKKAVFEKKRKQKHKETKQNTTLKSR